MTLPQPQNPTRLDLAAVLHALWPPLLVWGVSLAAFLRGGFPGVLCITPLAWTLALPVGVLVVRRSRGAQPLLEAGLAGGALGLAQALLFALVSVLVLPVKPGEATATLLMTGAIGLGGITGCAVLALAAAAWRRGRQ
jgi:hypothetical protein